MPINRKLEYTVLDLIESAARNSLVRPLNLGGFAGAGGGVGGPPGGFIGRLPQYQVGYDTFEIETLDTLPSGEVGASGWSLVDNLNHIRYRLRAIEDGVSISGIRIIDDDTPATYENIFTIHFTGEPVNITYLGTGQVEVAISGVEEANFDSTLYGRYNGTWVAFSGGMEEAPFDGSIYGRQDGAWVPIGSGVVSSGTLTVEDYDGNPSVTNVDKIIFSGATITPLGNGDVLVEVGSGGTGNLPYNLGNYLPDVPPATAGTYDDEFDDDVITGWTAPSYNGLFNMSQSSGSIHLSESEFHGYLLMQGNFAADGAYDFYKSFTPSASQAFTVVTKFSLGYNAVNNDIYCGLGIRGNADNVFYELRVGRNTVDKGFRTVYANGGGAAEGTITATDIPLVCYLMISHDGSKNFSAFVSGDGCGWVPVDVGRSLSNLSSFTRLSVFSKSGNTVTNGIMAIDFIRYFAFEKYYRIGKDV